MVFQLDIICLVNIIFNYFYIEIEDKCSINDVASFRLVWGIIGVLFLVAWPLSKLLEWLLGKNQGTFYRRAELEALVDIHGPEKSSPKKGRKLKKRIASLLHLAHFKVIIICVKSCIIYCNTFLEGLAFDAT